MNLVHKIKQEKYPNDDKFINSILNKTISYNDINYKFVPVKYEYYDNKANKIEKIIIITSNFQLDLIKEAKILFIDRTFKSCPRNFYQLLNIVSYLPEKDLIITILTAVLTSKTEYIIIH